MSSPQETYNAMATAATSKLEAPLATQAIQGFMAGAYVSLGALFANLMGGGFANDTLPALGSLVGGLVFPVGLVAIFLTGANLFTGNCMYVIPPLLNGTASKCRCCVFLLLSWLSNFSGALFVVFFIAYLGEFTNAEHNPAVHAYVRHNAEKKCNLKWSVALLRGIGANWLVCLAWWQAWSCKSTASKIISIWVPVYTFTAIGFEHSIANMFYVDIGLFEGAPNASLGKFLIRNLLPVTIGNFIGGGLFLGLVQYYTYNQAFLDSQHKEQSRLLLNSVE